MRDYFNKLQKKFYHHHPTQYIALIEKLCTESREDRTGPTHSHTGERSQKSPPTRERYDDVGTWEKRPTYLPYEINFTKINTNLFLNI